MKNFRLLVVSVFLLIIASSTGYSLPRFALLRADVNCLGCHSDPAGGGIRTLGGESFSINALPMWKRGDKFTGQLSEGVRLGMDFRSQYLSLSQEYPLFEADRLTKRTDTSETMKGMHAMSFGISMNASLTNSLHLNARYDLLANTVDAYGLLHFVHSSGEIFEADDIISNAYVKVGTFLPAFGIRFDDHTVYTRGGNRGLSGFNGAGLFWKEGYTDVGVELGASFFDRINVQFGRFNGSEEFPGTTFPFMQQDAAFSANISISNEFVEDEFSAMIGASMYARPRQIPADETFSGLDSSADVSLIGVYGGFRAGPVTVLAEYDMGKNIRRTSWFDYAAIVNTMLVEGTVTVTKGLDAILRYETYEDEPTEGFVQSKVKNRITIGAQWFPLRFLEIRPEYRMAAVEFNRMIGDVMRTDEITETTFVIQTHFFF